MRTPLALALLLSLSACAQVDSLVTDATRQMPTVLPTTAPTGVWDTTYGDMTFGASENGRLVATYKGENGRLDGTLQGRLYTGYWTEPSSARSCGSTRNGTPYWGRFSYTFNAAMNTFDGGWGYCDDAPSTEGDWTGVKR